MAIIESSKKRIKIGKRNRKENLRYLEKIRVARKELSDAKSKKAKEKALSQAYKAIDKAVKKGLIKDNKGARFKSQLAKQ